MVEKTVPECGHRVMFECGKLVSKYDCPQEVELEHIKLSCGHSLRGECRLLYAGTILL
jgi:hypothetical protein